MNKNLLYTIRILLVISLFLCQCSNNNRSGKTQSLSDSCNAERLLRISIDQENAFINDVLESIYESIKAELKPYLNTNILNSSIDTLYVSDSIFNPSCDPEYCIAAFNRRGNKIDTIRVIIKGSTFLTLKENKLSNVHIIPFRVYRENGPIASSRNSYSLYIGFSHVFFNSRRNEAVVETFVNIQPRRGISYIIYFKKSYDRWVLCDIDMYGIS